jgi:hypothetical protein
MVRKLALEVQKKFPARNKMSKASRDVQQAIRMLITTEGCSKIDKESQGW